MERTKKLSWLEQLKIACLKPREYPRLLQIGKGRVVCFFIVISFLITFLGYGMNVIGFSVSVGGTKNFIMNRLPEFELKNGTLEMDGTLNFELGGFHIVADTSEDQVDTDEFSNAYGGEVFFAKKEAVIHLNAMQQTQYQISFTNFKNAVVDNEAMLGLIPVVHLFIGIMFLINWIANILLYLLLCWFISLFVYMNQKARNEEISFGKVFRLSIYARVIFELIETLGTTAGMGFFSGSLWMIISYLGSYYLLGMAFVKTEDKKKSE